MYKKLKILVLFLVSISILSCSPEKRIARILKKNPHLLVKDTILIKDTITINSHSIDTTFIHIPSNDTVIVKDSVMIIKYVNNGKTVYLKGTCKEREVLIEKKVPYEKIVPVTKEVKPFYVKYLWIYFLITIVFFLLRFLFNILLRYLSSK